MNSKSYRLLTDILSSTLELPEADRESYLREKCGGDEELEAQARKLLAFSDPADGFFSDPVLERQRSKLDGLLDRVDDTEEHEDWLPERIASYEVIRTIGRGGTGVVFEARQASPARSVAIKLLHPAFATRETVLRLKREANVLGTLQHVGIAQIFDAGFFDAGAGEQPFLVMEYVVGPDLLTFAQAEGLGLQAKVRLIAQVADSVAHAHQRGIVHRDLKPDNILVRTSDGQPKLLDFGIAGGEGVEASVRATLDGQLLGTLGYMAPEQARNEARLVGPATDVFSLCAVAYELFASRPLRQVSGLSVTQALSEVGRREAPRLSEAILGGPKDLVTIIEKGLEIEPSARYSDASELAADLRRFIEDRPIIARPPSALDRSLKFMKRNPVLMAGVAATTAALVLGLITTLQQARIATKAEQRTTHELYAAEMVLATRELADPATSGQAAEVAKRWRDATRGPKASVELGWEWSLLDSVRRRRMVTMETDHFPVSIAWAPDGERLAVGLGYIIAIFDPDTGKEIQRMQFAQTDDLTGESILQVHLHWCSGDPERLIASGVGGVWCWVVGKPELNWHWGTEFSQAATALADGRVLALRSDHRLCELDGESGALIRSWEGPFAQQSSLDVHEPSGRMLLCSPLYETLVHDLESLAPLEFRVSLKSDISHLAWHPNGERFVYSQFCGLVTVCAVAPFQELFSFQMEDAGTQCVDWSRDGALLVTGSSDGSVTLFDSSSGRQLRSLIGHQRSVVGATFNPVDDRIATVGSEDRVIVWDPAEPDAIADHVFPGFGSSDKGASLVWKESLGLLVADVSGTLLKWDPCAIEGPTLDSGLVRSYLSYDGRWVYSIGRDAETQIRNAEGEIVFEWDGARSDPGLNGAWHPTENVFVAISTAGVFSLRFDSSGQCEPKRISDFEAQVREVKWSPDGRAIAAASWAGPVVGVDPATGEGLFRHAPEYPIDAACIAWSPDGSSIAVGCSDGSSRIYGTHLNGESEAAITTMRGHVSDVTGIDWHPDGSRVATSSNDRTVRLWEPGTGRMVGCLQCKGRVADVAWADGGNVLVAVDFQGRFYTYDATRSLSEGHSGPPE